MLSIKGKIFSGKSVLMKNAVAHKMRDPATLVLQHFFYHVPGQVLNIPGQSFIVFLRNLLGQLLSTTDDLEHHQVQAWAEDIRSRRNGRLWAKEALRDAIKTTLLEKRHSLARSKSSIRIFVDGINLCLDTDDANASPVREEDDNGPFMVLNFLAELLQYTSEAGIDARVCVSRRQSTHFGHLEPVPDTAVITVDEYASSETIKLAQSRLSQLQDPRREMEALEAMKCEWSDGFQWVHLTTTELLRGVFSVADTMQVVQNVSQRHKDLYRKLLHSIKPLSKSLSCPTQLILLGLGSNRPLTIDEFRQAIAYSYPPDEAERYSFRTMDEWEYSSYGLPAGEDFERLIRTRTGDLLDISARDKPQGAQRSRLANVTKHLDGMRRVVFSHLSIEKFLRSSFDLHGPGRYETKCLEEAANRLLFRICTNVLNSFTFKDSIDKYKGKEIFDYACEFWLHHAHKCGKLPRGWPAPKFLRQRCDLRRPLQLLQNQQQFLARSLAMEHALLEEPYDPNKSMEKPHLMLVLATMGCTELLGQHLEKCSHCQKAIQLADTQKPFLSGAGDSVYSTALKNTVLQGYTDTALYLLKLRPTKHINAPLQESTLLYDATYFAGNHPDAAVRASRIKCVRFLLDEVGANPCVESTFAYNFPLHVALMLGDVPLVKLLMEKKPKAVLTAPRSHNGETALHLAMRKCAENQLAAVEMMLELAPDGLGLMAKEDSDGRTPRDVLEARERCSDEVRQNLEDVLDDFEEKDKAPTTKKSMPPPAKRRWQDESWMSIGSELKKVRRSRTG